MKLLQRTVRTYLIYSLLVVLVAIPVFYGIIHQMFMEDVDNVLRQRRDELVAKLNAYPDESSWQFLQDMDENILIRPVAPGSPARDRIYNRHQYDRKAGELEPLRVLSCVAIIHNKTYRIILRQSLIDSEDLSQGILVTQAILLVALLAGLLLINRYQSAKIWRPFYDTLEKLKAFELDKEPRLKLDAGRIREFSDLNQAIRQLVEKNYQVYMNQKAFTENAAHEMQTPLAIFRSKLDLLLQHQSLDSNQAEQIQSLSQTVDRLHRLNKSLLLLSRIENRQYLEKTPVQVPAVVEKTLKQSEDMASAMELDIKADLQEPVIASANPVLADILVSNLLTNAIIHNVQRGWIRLAVKHSGFEISNSGPPLPFDPGKIFDRFQKNPANAASTGLGLAIVKQICDVSGFSIKYSFGGMEYGHTVTVRFEPFKG
jgi:two-component system sensor histidine kinase QseC